MPRSFQMLLLAFGVLALLAVGGEITYSILATTHGSTPARVVQTQAGPYRLKVSLYTYPAHASYALPFAVAPTQAVEGTLTYQISSVPDPSDVPATPVRATFSSDPAVRNSVQGDAEITVQGEWMLQITVSGPAGAFQTAVPILATAPPAIPLWLGWLIGGLPLYGLLAFLLLSAQWALNMDRVSFWVSNPGNAMRLTKIVRCAQADDSLLHQCHIGFICVVSPDNQFCTLWARVQDQPVIGQCCINRRNGQQKLTKAHLNMDRNTILWCAECLGESQEISKEMHCSHDISDEEVERWITETETFLTRNHMNIILLIAVIE